MNNQITKDHQKYLGGIWLDLNEPANFKEINSFDSNDNLSCWSRPPDYFDQFTMVEQLKSNVDPNIDLVKKQIKKLDSENIPLINRMAHRLEFKTMRLDCYTSYNKEMLDEVNEEKLGEKIKNRMYLSHIETHAIQSLMQIFLFNLALRPYYKENQENVFILSRSNVFG